MDEEEALKKVKDSYAIGEELDRYSLFELDTLVELLKGEIKRIEETKASKSIHMDAAESLFKS